MKSMIIYTTCTALLICVVMGCQQEPDDRTANTKTPTETDKSITFADRVWILAGPCQSTGDILRPSMSAVYYTTTEDNIRLIELVVNKSSSQQEGIFSRILRIQTKKDGRWISHGESAEWELNGARGEVSYKNGEPHGTQRRWYPNGKLHIERQWVNGKMHGRDRGWYSNGQPQYDAQNINGEEVSGQAWDKDGQPL